MPLPQHSKKYSQNHTPHTLHMLSPIAATKLDDNGHSVVWPVHNNTTIKLLQQLPRWNISSLLLAILWCKFQASNQTTIKRKLQ